MTPILLRRNLAAEYCGMGVDSFDKIVRPHVREIRIGKKHRGVAFYRLDLDGWAADYARAEGCPSNPMEDDQWVRNEETASPSEAISGGLTNGSTEQSIRESTGNKCFRRGRGVPEEQARLNLRDAHLDAEVGEYLNRKNAKAQDTEESEERPKRTFNEAAARYILENGHRRSLPRDDLAIRTVMPFIGELRYRRHSLRQIAGMCGRAAEDGHCQCNHQPGYGDRQSRF